MPRKHGEPAIAPLPSPFPEGWFYVASVRDVRKAGLVQKTWMGESIVTWIDDAGQVCVAEAICPHLGSFLGPSAGGRVSEGQIVCPFHGFEFDTSGRCVHTPYAAPPRSARLRVFATRIVCGLVFGWWGIDGREPQWDLPSEEPDQTGWCDLRIRTLRFRGHPQETTENSVDLAHLRYVHGYGSVDRVDPLAIDGPYPASVTNLAEPNEFAPPDLREWRFGPPCGASWRGPGHRARRCCPFRSRDGSGPTCPVDIGRRPLAKTPEATPATGRTRVSRPIWTPSRQTPAGRDRRPAGRSICGGG